MSRIEIPDVSPPICPAQLEETLGDSMALDQITIFVCTYTSDAVLDAAVSAQAAVFLLPVLQGEKPFPHVRNKRKRSHARFGLRGIGCEQNALASDRVPRCSADRRKHQPESEAQVSFNRSTIPPDVFF